MSGEMIFTPGGQLRVEVEKKHVLREEQAGFRQERLTTDQIATLHNIIEQSLEWNTTFDSGLR